MPTAEEFDEFYVSTRRDLILQTFALTGDLAASRTAVRDAYVAARHHWDKVGRDPDPLTWVRPQAWSRAQRRHTTRPWHRERHIDADQTATLEALHKLRDAPRRTLVLSVLTGLSPDQIAREIGQPLTRVEEHLAAATRTVSGALECEPGDIPERLAGLAPAIASVKLPRPTIVRRNGLRRRRNFAIVGSVVIAAVLLGAGSFVAVDANDTPLARPKTRDLIKTTRAALLAEDQIGALAPGQTWQKPETSQNDDENSSGLNTSCQQQRYADKAADGAFVRTFATAAGPKRTLVQAVEISKTTAEAEAAYATTRTWYADCRAARIQLLSTYAVSQVGNQAQVLLLQGPSKKDPSFAVGLARTGKLTISVVLEVTAATQVPVGAMAATLATSVRNLCGSKAADACTGRPTTTATRPPPASEAPGMLTAVDLPPIAGVNAMWNVAPLESAVRNNAATVCDKADFARSGAANPMGRGFLLSNDKAPKLFGVTETIGKFASAKAAAKFVTQVKSKMKTCQKRVLSSKIRKAVIRGGTASRPPYAFWRLVNQTQKVQDITYWMGITQVGSYVAQVTMFPVGKYDVSTATFGALVVRSRDRLFEVS